MCSLKISLCNVGSGKVNNVGHSPQLPFSRVGISQSQSLTKNLGWKLFTNSSPKFSLSLNSNRLEPLFGHFPWFFNTHTHTHTPSRRLMLLTWLQLIEKVIQMWCNDLPDTTKRTTWSTGFLNALTERLSAAVERNEWTAADERRGTRPTPTFLW